MIPSAQREFGEVFTPRKIVDKMFDLIKFDKFSPHFTMLDSSAGDGAFLSIALSKKLANIKGCDVKSFKYMIISLASIYGIDLQNKNIVSLKQNLELVFKKNFKKRYKRIPLCDEEKLINKILSLNIVQGDSLKYIKSNGQKMRMSELTFKGYKYWWTKTNVDPNIEPEMEISESYNILTMENWDE